MTRSGGRPPENRRNSGGTSMTKDKIRRNPPEFRRKSAGVPPEEKTEEISQSQ